VERPGAHAVRRESASIATATRMIAPRMKSWKYGLTPRRLKPLRMNSRKRTPSTVRQTAPRPPRMLVPPTTTPAIAAQTTSPRRHRGADERGEPVAGDSRAGERDQDRAGGAAREAAEGERRDAQHANVDPREPRRLGVAADRVDPAPDLRPGEEQPGREREAE